jgi:hypothetical protein
MRIGGWNPKKTFEELKDDPLRAARAVGTMGQSEMLQGAEKTYEARGGGSLIGETPKINIEDVYKPVTVTNPYEEQLKAALQQNMGPDFARAQATAGQQGQFAQALQGLYGTGAAGLTGLIGTLQRQQAGDFGPGGSLAQKILEQGLGQNIAGVRSQLASQRGLNPALAARYAAEQTAQLGGQSAQQAGILGLQQQLGAQQMLGQLTTGAAQLGSKAGDIYGQMRGQDIAQATATSDAALKRLGVLASSDTGIRQLQMQTGLQENEIRQKIAAANQAAAAGDRQMVAQIIGSITGGASAGLAKAAVGAFSGGRIDGKAPVPGDHPKNDVVDAKLSPGEIVIPRSAAGSKKAAKSFIDSLDDWDDEPSYGKVLKARQQKKNYADGGVVEPDLDKEILDKYRSLQLRQSYAAPVPGVERFKQGLDTMLTENVVEPLARRGYENLGAGIATVPSTLAEALLPSSMAEMQAVIPLPGAKLGRKALQEVRKENAEQLMTKMAQDDVDISKLPTSKEYKQFAKQYQELKKADLRRGYREERNTQKNEKVADKVFSKIFGSQAEIGSWSPKSWDLEALAYENADIPEIRKAIEKVELLDPTIYQSQEKGVLNLKSYEKAKIDLYKTLESNKDNLKFSDELERTKKIRKFPQDMFTGIKPK